MQLAQRMTFLRRLASILLAVCFVLPLSQCDTKFDEGGKPVEVTRHTELRAYELVQAYVQDVGKGELAKGLQGIAIVASVFFLPLASWKLRQSGRALVHVAASPFTGYVLFGWVFVFASRPLFGGILAVLCWAVLLLSNCVTLAQRLRQRRRQKAGVHGAGA
ncbi:hypothetical protein G4G28_20185 [Massilia sp. Dwa41.01b]|uniref:hypothetical protein n=1 Tax=unclassified Massilia TaxID=2609279 RepID=UPI00160382E2|nr:MULTISPECIES: hypothetical protein [unclassified Massilia]QNA90238.1 hypothetical protein G4G28_20185 [Massilia sp. Dwa41.01b]QNB01131.1 hypothetical protein G4G31_23785 [Massilia sp. Se16.2.3]